MELYYLELGRSRWEDGWSIYIYKQKKKQILEINIKSRLDFALPSASFSASVYVIKQREFILYEKGRTLLGFACSLEQSGLEKEPTSWSWFNVEELQIEEAGEEVVGMCSAVQCSAGIYYPFCKIFVFVHLSTFTRFFFLMHSFTAETTVLSFTYFTKSSIVFFESYYFFLTASSETAKNNVDEIYYFDYQMMCQL